LDQAPNKTNNLVQNSRTKMKFTSDSTNFKSNCSVAHSKHVYNSKSIASNKFIIKDFNVKDAM